MWAQIPLRTFGEWTNVPPGHLQADLLAHCGETTHGFYLTSLLAIDVATGWTELQAVWGKGHKRVGTAVYLARQALPMPLRSLHTDNGGEFLNHILVPRCRGERGVLTPERGAALAAQSQARGYLGHDRFSLDGAYIY